MEITKVKGIIISESNYSETSKLLNIFTKEYGLISAIAKGAKRLKSPLRSVTSKLTYAEFQLNYKEGKLSNLLVADVINPFNEIKKDLLKISYASFLLELTSQVAKQTNEKDLFDILEASLIKIEEGYDPMIITNILELKYLDYLGIKPELNSCAVCGSTKVLTVSTNKGGFVCTNCHRNEKIVDKKTIKVLRMLYYVDISKISKIELNENTKEEIDTFINEYYDKYTGLYLKSKKFLKSIKNVYI
ncbi:MAG: DNA repair protein RecO [Bacilli bacterium]|nr:DNA repair protein RecO [Bacilli bacterium]MBO6194883.1 DNA repair protein RecO [Bacilli bacterium]